MSVLSLPKKTWRKPYPPFCHLYSYAPFSFGHVLPAETYFKGANPRPKKKKDIVDRLLEYNREDESFGIEFSETSISSEASDYEEIKTEQPKKNAKSKNKKVDIPVEEPKPAKDISKPKRGAKAAAVKDIEPIITSNLEDDGEESPIEEKPKTPGRSKPGRPPKAKPAEVTITVIEEEPKIKRRGRPPSKKKYKDPEDQTTSLSPMKTGAELDLDSAEPKEVEVNENSKSELANPPIGRSWVFLLTF